MNRYFLCGWVSSEFLPELCGDVVGGDASSVLNVSSALEVSIRSIPSSFRSIPSAVFCLFSYFTVFSVTTYCSNVFPLYDLTVKLFF